VPRAHGAMVFYVFLVAVSFLVGKAITDGLEPVVLTLLRFVLSAILFGFLTFARERWFWPTPVQLFRYSLISAAMVIFFLAMFEALRWTDPISIGAIFTLVPLVSVVIAFLLMRQRTGVRQLLYLILGGMGAVWVLFDGSLEYLLAFRLGKGELIFAIGCLTYGAYAPLVACFHRGEPIMVMTFWVLALGALMLAIIGAPEVLRTDWAAIPGKVWVGVVYLATFSTALTFFIFKFASVALPASKVMGYTYLTTTFVVLLEVILGYGLPSLSVVAGLALSIGATALLQRS
jgi:drug/metabolite transporter (DMT)-like permease